MHTGRYFAAIRSTALFWYFFSNEILRTKKSNPSIDHLQISFPDLEALVERAGPAALSASARERALAYLSTFTRGVELWDACRARVGAHVSGLTAEELRVHARCARFLENIVDETATGSKQTLVVPESPPMEVYILLTLVKTLLGAQDSRSRALQEELRGCSTNWAAAWEGESRRYAVETGIPPAEEEEGGIEDALEVLRIGEEAEEFTDAGFWSEGEVSSGSGESRGREFDLGEEEERGRVSEGNGTEETRKKGMENEATEHRTIGAVKLRRDWSGEISSESGENFEQDFGMEEDGETEQETEKEGAEKERTEEDKESKATERKRTEDEARTAGKEWRDEWADWHLLEGTTSGLAASVENGTGQRNDQNHRASFQSRSAQQAPSDLQRNKGLGFSTAEGLGLLLAEESQVGFSVGSTESSGISSTRAHSASRPVSANRPGSARRKAEQAAKGKKREMSALE